MTNLARDVHVDILSQHAAAHPDAIAIIDDPGFGQPVQVSYKSLNERANQIANAIVAEGVRPGERIAWCGRNCIDVLAIDYAAGKAGSSATGLNHRLTRPEIISILEAMGAVLLFVEAEFAPMMEGLESETPLRSVIAFGGPAGSGQKSLETLTAGAGINPPQVDRTGRRPESIGLSSGTTGQPKVILRGGLVPGGPQQQIQDEIWGAGPYIFITSGAISSGAAGAFGFIALARGGTVVLQKKFDPEDWLRLVDHYKVTVAYCPPFVIRQVCALPDDVLNRYDVSSIRAVFAGAAKWSQSVKLDYRAHFPEGTLWEIYGATELGIVTAARPDEHWIKPESCGRPIPGVDVILLDPDGNVITEPFQQGILYARTSSSFVGYENDPGAQENATWGDGYFTVWDVAYFDQDGFFCISDRVKDMIVSGGINVYPAEVEAVLDGYPGVHENAVFGIPDDTWGEAVHALVVPERGVTIDEDALRAYCREQLASHKVPRSFEFVSELPHTLSGKILKQPLRAKYWEGEGRTV